MFFWRRSHDIGEEQISAYIDGQLDDAEAAQVEAHVEACSACRDTLAELRTLQSTLRELPQVAAPRSFALREADVQPAPVTRASGGRAPALLGGLASVALVAFLTLVSVDVLNQGSSADDALRVSGLSGEAADGSAEGRFNAAEKDALGGVIANDAKGSDAQTPDLDDEEDVASKEPVIRGPVSAADDGAQPEGGAPEATTRADDGDSNIPLRVGEAAAAAVALAAAGGFAFAWRRRRVNT